MTVITDTPSNVIDTKFGRFDVRADSIIAFAEGLPGFEDCRRFVLLSSEAFAPLRCLQGLEGSRPSFLAIEPSMVQPDYRRGLSVADQERLDDDGTNLAWLALVTVAADDQAVVNLRAPVVINAARMIGLQVIHPHHRYRIDHPLVVG